MGFLDWFFGLFFSKKKEAEKVPSHTAISYVEGCVLSDAKSLEKTVFSRMAELKHLLLALESSVNEIKSKGVSMTEGNFRLRHAVVSSRETLAVQFGSLVKKLQPPKTFDLVEMNAFTESSIALLSREVIVYRKSIAFAKTVLSAEVLELGKNLSEIEKVFLSLRDDFSRVKLSELFLFKKNFDALDNSFKEKKEFDALQRTALLDVDNVSLKKKRLALDLEELKKSSFAQELLGLEEKKKQLFDEKNAIRQRFLSLLEKVDKPLSRFLQMAQSGDAVVSQQERELALSYFQNIFIASKKDPKAESLKKILSRTLELVENGSIALKDKEKEKKAFALRELLEFDFFSELFWKLNSLDAELVVVEKSISESNAGKKLLSLERELSFLSNEVLQKQSASQKLSVRLSQKEKEFFMQKLSAEQTASELCGRQVEFVFEQS